MDYKTSWRVRTRLWAVELLGGTCVRCGTDQNLTFDHVSGDKDFEISVGIRDGYSRTRLKVELRKCQLLCDPCHRRKSTECGETGGGWNKIVDPAHGTAVMYGRLKCRCRACKLWKQQYRAKLVDSQGMRL